MVPARIIGSFISPYVRKVLVCLDLKGIAYEIDPIVPFYGNDRFSEISPLRRVPVLLDDRVSLCDSSVICQYIEDRYPQPRLYPEDIVDRARARWLEEFADSRLGEVLIWGLFNQVVIKPFVFGEPTDQQILDKTLQSDIPHVLDYLESQVPSQNFCFGESLFIGDISIASFFRNAAFARFAIDATRWPKTAAFVERVLATPSFQKLIPIEKKMIRTPPLQQREALAEMGVALTSESLRSEQPRRGLMRI